MGYGLGRENVGSNATARTVLLTSADSHFRSRMRQELTAMRWQVREAAGGAEAMELLEAQDSEAMVLDSALPDLEVGEFAGAMRRRYPVMDLLRIDETTHEGGALSPRRNELLHALRQVQRDTHTSCAMAECAAWTLAPVEVPQRFATERLAPADERSSAAEHTSAAQKGMALLHGRDTAQPGKSLGQARHEADKMEAAGPRTAGAKTYVSEGCKVAVIGTKNPVQTSIFAEETPAARQRVPTPPLPDMVGQNPEMLELSRLIRLVAPRPSTVLIEGETGTGKELVARAVHRLSARSAKPFVVLNCAAIPEALLEAELFGHTRGAFTGAVQSRTGRIEAAHGGTLFLDEIGEMPLALQSKVLRFLESGELQRVGDNEAVHVDVRVVAATHEPLLQRTTEHAFRLDLYHRLAVFPVFVPALRDRMDDVLPLAEHMLARLGQEAPVKRLSPGAAARLMQHDWPGNVRELEHVLERATILAEDRREIARDEIRF